MIIEKYVIETGVRSIKYLSYGVKAYILDSNISHAEFLLSKESAEHYLGLDCLKGKNPRVKKVKITYEVVDAE
jgi:hypothetical protein